MSEDTRQQIKQTLKNRFNGTLPRSLEVVVIFKNGEVYVEPVEDP